MRKWHRWISTAAMVLLAWVALTGVLLAIDSMYPPAGLGGAPAAAPTGQTPADGNAITATQTMDMAAVELWMTSAAQAVLTAEAPQSIEIQLHMQDNQPRAQVAVKGSDTRTITVNVQTGTVLSSIATAAESLPWYQDTASRLRLHDLLQDLHRGTIIGLPGQILDILTGLSFAFLTISGAVMYFQLYLRRRKSGNRQWFWK